MDNERDNFKGWEIVERRQDGISANNKTLGLFVIASTNIESDNKCWLHVSLSRKKRLPTYADMVLVKELFIGKRLYAYQVFPPKDKHVNLHPNVLHLWHCMDGDPLPEFSGMMPFGRSI